MPTPSRSGRPRASSREVLAEAACELFLERGYHATSVSDITRRAGVSRSSFFNYFEGKAEVLWGGLDERIRGLADELHRDETPDAAETVRVAVAGLARGFHPDSLALALGQAEAMGLVDELFREGAVRRARIATAVADRLRRGGADTLSADVLGAALGGAVLAAVERWAVAGAGRTALEPVLARALDVVREPLSRIGREGDGGAGEARGNAPA